MGQDVTDQYGNEFVITASPKVAAISYSSSAVNHVTGATGTQIARFTITLRCVKLASGWSDPEVDWINDCNNWSSPTPGDVVITTNVNGLTASGEVYAAGAYTANVSVHLIDPQHHEHDGLWTARVAAIGGPITISVKNGLYDHTGHTWVNDNGVTTNPFFLEYFGYTHASAKPANFQQTQDGDAKVDPQPTNAMVTWTIPGSTMSAYLAAHGTQPNCQDIDLEAESPFVGGVVSAAFSYSFTDTDGQEYSGTAADDTTSTVIKMGVPQHTQFMVNEVSGHKPGSIAMVNNQTVDPGGHPPATGWAGTQFNLLLTDTNGANFPGVQIQELFVPNDPPEAGFNTNKSLWNPPWVTQISPPGQSDKTDELTYLWYGTDEATRAFVHHYWAACMPLVFGFGIDIGAFTMIFTWGTPGTAVQH